MHTYVKLKDDTIWILWSDNTEEETMHVYPLDKEDDFDVEYDMLKVVKYNEVACTIQT